MPVAAATLVPQGRQQPSHRVLETVILSSYLLFWIPPIIGQLHSWSHSSDPGTVISENSPEIWFDHVDEVCSSTIGTELIFTHLGYSHMCSADTFIREPKTENVTAENISKIFGKYLQEGSTLKSVAVYSCPLDAPFSSSKVSVKKRVQRQYTSLDYHAFVVFESGAGVWIALDKMKDGIFVSWGRNLGSVLLNFEGKSRPKPLRLLKIDGSNSSSSELIHHLKEVFSSNKYDLIRKNCQHFSRKMFDKHAIGQSWDFVTPLDKTSFLNILNNGGLPFIMVAYFVCLVFELWSLSEISEYLSTELKMVRFIVIVPAAALFIVIIVDPEHDLLKDLAITTPICGILLFSQFLEALLISPFWSVKRRAAHYGRRMWKTNIFPLKIFLTVSYTVIYSLAIPVALAHLQKCFLQYGEVSSFSLLLKGCQWLTELLQVGVNWNAFFVFLIIWALTYYILQTYFFHPKLPAPEKFKCPLPYGKCNGTSTLNEILQYNGANHAKTPKHNETSSSPKLSFTLLDKKHEYMLDTKCRNTKEARQYAAFAALVDLKLMKPPHSEKANPLNETVSVDGPQTNNIDERPPMRSSISALLDFDTYQRTPEKNSKNLLQEFCQKYKHDLPAYDDEKYSDNNSKLFAATVTVKLSGGQTVKEVSDRLRSKKEAHFQAAERALKTITSGLRSRNNSSDSLASMSSLRSVPDEVNIREFERHIIGSPNTDRRGSSPAPGHVRIGTASPKPSSEKNYKNLLQEFCLREGLDFPSYATDYVKGSKGKKPLFVSEVTITLKSGKTLSKKSDKHSRKKDAEMMAAERAYRSIPATRFPTPPVREASPAPKFTNCQHSPEKSYKNLLQEFCAQRAYQAPQYVTKEDKHEHVWVSEVFVELDNGIQFSTKSDRLSRKKAAEVQAAKRAFEKICAKDYQTAGS